VSSLGYSGDRPHFEQGNIKKIMSTTTTTQIKEHHTMNEKVGCYSVAIDHTEKSVVMGFPCCFVLPNNPRRCSENKGRTSVDWRREYELIVEGSFHKRISVAELVSRELLLSSSTRLSGYRQPHFYLAFKESEWGLLIRVFHATCIPSTHRRDVLRKSDRKLKITSS
jgi:hypothetical protein